MIINVDLQGRSRTGKYARRPVVELEPDDFPPNSEFWKRASIASCSELRQKMGRDDYHAWADMVWPGETIDEHSDRDIAEIADETLFAYDLGKTQLPQLIEAAMQSSSYRHPDDMECTCKPDSVQACPACRRQARSAVETNV